MKKTLSVVLALIILVFSMCFPVYAQENSDVFRFSLKSNVSGLTWDDYEEFAVFDTEKLKYDTGHTNPVGIYTYAGDVYIDELKPGRTYYISHSFVAADGYEFPEEFNEENMEFDCEKGCTVLWYNKTKGYEGLYVTYDGLYIYTKVVVDGNIFQRIFGRIADWFLKIKAWSPY